MFSIRTSMLNFAIRSIKQRNGTTRAQLIYLSWFDKNAWPNIRHRLATGWLQPIRFWQWPWRPEADMTIWKRSSCFHSGSHSWEISPTSMANGSKRSTDGRSCGIDSRATTTHCAISSRRGRSHKSLETSAPWPNSCSMSRWPSTGSMSGVNLNSWPTTLRHSSTGRMIRF